jgi:enoyl-CoA hydratase
LGCKQEHHEAFDRAAHADEVRVIILAAEDKHFSAGHDLSESDSADAMKRYRTVGTMCGFGLRGCRGPDVARVRDLRRIL